MVNVCNMQKSCTCETKSYSARMYNSCKMHACGINVCSIYLHCMRANISHLTHKCYLHAFCVVRNIQATSMLHLYIFVRDGLVARWRKATAIRTADRRLSKNVNDVINGKLIHILTEKYLKRRSSRAAVFTSERKEALCM